MGDPLQVLFVEDNAMDVELAMLELEAAGFELQWQRADTEAAYLAALERVPDLIIADHAMPRFDAPRALALLQRRGLDIPFILVSGTVGEEAAAAMMRAGAHDYILKGHLARLPEAVRRELREARVRAQEAAGRQALRESEERFRRVVETMPDTLYVAETPDLRTCFVSPAIERLTGYTPAQWLGDPSIRLRLLGEECLRARVELVRSVPVDRRFAQLSYPVQTRDGSRRWVQDRMALVRNDAGQVEGVFGVVTDITQRREAEQEMHKLSQVVRQAADAIMITDPDGMIEYVNPAFEAISGYSRGEVTGLPVSVLRSGKHDAEVYSNLWQTVRSGRTFRDVLTNRRKDGSLFTNEQVITPLVDDNGRVSHYISTARDITEQIYTKERLGYLAYHDPLTGLRNRAALAEQMVDVLHHARRTGGRVALVMLGLDRFKLVNETLGYEAGDQTLKLMAQRLADNVREADVVARLEGDEFALVLQDLESVDDIVVTVRQIRQCVAEPLVVGGREFYLTASVGVCSCPDDGEDTDALLRYADIALNRAKQQGKNGYQFYSEEMSTHAVHWFTTEVDLRHALERGEFRVHYQPQVDLHTGHVVGVEALLRWQHPERGLLGPNAFMPMLEETGLIVDVSAWVLGEACRQGRLWQRAGLPPVKVAVNISWRQFTAGRLANHVAAALELSGLAAEHLELELTESVLAHDPERANRCLQQLKGYGISVSLDDFGTGYSSLSYLKRFPIDTVKIDKSFIAEITSDPDDAAIARAIIAMSHSLRMKVVAEGVETEGQLGFLQRHGCDAMQGYYFSRPVCADDMAMLLSQRRKVETPVRVQTEQRTLLVVDDEKNIRRAVTRSLQVDGYRILSAACAVEAFEILATNDVGVVLSDQRMPGMTGTEFLARVRELYPAIVRMVLSGYTDVKTVTEAVNRGQIYKFLTKPWDDDELRREVNAAFERYEQSPGPGTGRDLMDGVIPG
ncbi:MAG TPA: EAL domain-containing protein [Gammaproteobacteria bacterium]|nr:EAL domain-containing protein [Gammaproteobacteria bacterium]